MNDQRFEHEIRAALDEGAPMLPPNHLLHTFEFNARHARRYPRWLALIKEPPMRTESHIAVGSSTARLAATVVATVLLAALLLGASFAGARLLAAGGPIIVDQSGGGTTTTIGEAVAMAEDGDEVLVRPGTYAESVVVDKDIRVRGEDRDAVILAFPDGPDTYPHWYGTGPYGIHIDDASPEISDLTIRGPGGDISTAAIVVEAGAPSIHDITVIDNEPIHVIGGSKAIVRDSDLRDAWTWIDAQSEALVEDSRFLALVVRTNTIGPDGPGPTLRANQTQGITLEGPAILESNEITPGEIAASDDPMYGSGIDVTHGAKTFVIRGNTVSGFAEDDGISAIAAGKGVISGNTISRVRTGVALGVGETVVSDNTVSDAGTGYVLTGRVDFSGNAAEGVEGRAIIVGSGGAITLSANRACGNGVDLFVNADANVTIADDNEFCVIDQAE